MCKKGFKNKMSFAKAKRAFFYSFRVPTAYVILCANIHLRLS